jgi:hypothetical protein
VDLTTTECSTAPAVTATTLSPANGATTTSLAQPLVVTFDAPIDTSTGTVALTGSGATNITYDLSMNPLRSGRADGARLRLEMSRSVNSVDSGAEGGRFTLRLGAHDDNRARYAAELTVGTDTWQGAAVVAVQAGAVTFEGDAEHAPAWLQAAARAVLREKWRARQSAQLPWPRRITRWRARPEGA